MCLSGWYLKREKRAVNDETLYSFLYLTLTCLDFVETTYTYKSHVDDSEEDDDSDLAKLRASFCYGRHGIERQSTGLENGGRRCCRFDD